MRNQPLAARPTWVDYAKLISVYTRARGPLQPDAPGAPILADNTQPGSPDCKLGANFAENYLNKRLEPRFGHVMSGRGCLARPLPGGATGSAKPPSRSTC